MKRILVIEDDVELMRGLKDNLEAEGYEVITAPDGQVGLMKATSAEPDVVILDLMLPTMSGFEVCRRLKNSGFTVPILILSARLQESDKIQGLEFGADDYVTKPFSIHELLARVKVILRRANTLARGVDQYAFSNVVVNFRRQLIWRDDRALTCSTLEFNVMRYLIAREGEAVTREQLLSEVWGYQSFPTTRSVDNLIVRLRQKLETDPHHPRHLLTVHGAGYKFIA